jgi:hypothetical protein
LNPLAPAQDVVQIRHDDARASKKMAQKPLAKNGPAKSLVTLKVTLRGTKPPVWRRLQMPGAMTLGALHEAIQAAMGWHGGHLHAFEVGGRQYGDRQMVDDVADENRLTLNGLVRSGATRFAYIYDFGDNWEHAVVIEKCEPSGDGAAIPVCLAGKRNCPPEDCGGVWGYADLLEILADKSHPEHAERMEWLGEDFDPEEFCIATANRILNARFG